MKDEILELAKTGMLQKDIATAIGCSKSRVGRVMRNAGLTQDRSVWHSLKDIDVIKRTANCLQCGPVRLLFEGSIPRCSKRGSAKRARQYSEGARPPIQKIWTEYKVEKCSRCGFVAEDPCQLDVDHVGGRNIDDPHNPQNLQTLCANCHRLRTSRPDLFALVPDYAIGDVEWYI